MNRTLLLAVCVCVGAPAAIFINRILTTYKRAHNAQLMQETTTAMMHLTLAVQQYSQDYNDRLPPMKNPAVLQQALLPYSSGYFSSRSGSQSSLTLPTKPDIFVSPASGQQFVPNSSLQGRTLKSLSNLTAVFYDAKPLSGPNNPNELFRVVGYNNHVITVPERKWQREKKDSGIP